jgi:hypothetical protein
MAVVMMRLTMKTAIMMVESAVALAHRAANVPNVPVLVEMMILVTVSPTVSTILISVMGSILGFFTLQNGIDFMINIKLTPKAMSRVHCRVEIFIIVNPFIFDNSSIV